MLATDLALNLSYLGLIDKVRVRVRVEVGVRIRVRDRVRVVV